MSFKNVFAGLIMLLCVTTVGCDLNITAFRIEKAKKFEWVYYSINGRERGLKVLPPKFKTNHEAEKLCRDEEWDSNITDAVSDVYSPMHRSKPQYLLGVS
ncbi:hypothetical protein GCK32_006174 [Trichostrongylus colubriformis]|uniref:Uncharacterized protein n=1 Tax=Trichostrongylus colubriformis TaxID=6319 RepID=A0AAN8J1C3_TRICO